MPRISVLIAVLCLLFSSGCSYFRLPVLQGNIVDYEKAEKLRLGMTPSQVEFLLGTPLIRDSFGTPRWDYVVYYRNPDAKVLQKNMSIYFEDGQVSRIEGRDELLADWRKSKALIEKVKKEKEKEPLETPHPGQFPAAANQAPGEAASGEEPHPVLPPRDPDTREEILEDEPQETDSGEEASAPPPPESSGREQPQEAPQSKYSDESQAQSESDEAENQASSYNGSTENGSEEEAYPADMSTIYRKR